MTHGICWSCTQHLHRRRPGGAPQRLVLPRAWAPSIPRTRRIAGSFVEQRSIGRRSSPCCSLAKDSDFRRPTRMSGDSGSRFLGRGRSLTYYDSPPLPAAAAPSSFPFTCPSSCRKAWRGGRATGSSVCATPSPS